MDDALVEASALCCVGLLRSEELPELATQALLRGVDTPSLRRLAGLNPRDVRDVRDAFESAMIELEIDPLPADDAWWLLTYRKLRRVVAGELSPEHGARWVWAHAAHEVELEGDLRIFIGLASELEDHPDARDEIEAQIVNEARELLNRPSPRRWIKLQATFRESSLSSCGRNERVFLPTVQLPVSDALREAIDRWTADYQSTFDTEAGSSGFASQADAVGFVERGRELVRELQEDLGSSWHVEYMPEPVGLPGLRLRS